MTPAEIVAGLTTALAHDYAEADPYEANGRFLASPSYRWADAVRPLTDAGWSRDGGAELGTVEIIAPEGQAGVLIDNRRSRPDDEAVTLWAGPPGWGTRAEAIFSARTPTHLIAATAAAMADPAPAVGERHMIHREAAHLISLTPVSPPAPPRFLGHPPLLTYAVPRSRRPSTAPHAFLGQPPTCGSWPRVVARIPPRRTGRAALHPLSGSDSRPNGRPHAGAADCFGPLRHPLHPKRPSLERSSPCLTPPRSIRPRP